MIFKEFFKRLRERRAARTCMTEGHVVPPEATNELRRAYLHGNISPSAPYVCLRCGKPGTTAYIPGTRVDPHKRVPF